MNQTDQELEKRNEEIQALRDQLYKQSVALREAIDVTSMFEEIVGPSKSRLEGAQEY